MYICCFLFFDISLFLCFVQLENQIDDLKRINEKLEQKFLENKDKEKDNNDEDRSKKKEKYFFYYEILSIFNRDI